MKILISLIFLLALIITINDTTFSKFDERWKYVGDLNDGTPLYFDTKSVVFPNNEYFRTGELWLKMNEEIYFLEVYCDERRYTLKKDGDIVTLYESIPPQSFVEQFHEYLCI